MPPDIGTPRHTKVHNTKTRTRHEGHERVRKRERKKRCVWGGGEVLSYLCLVRGIEEETKRDRKAQRERKKKREKERDMEWVLSCLLSCLIFGLSRVLGEW